VLRFFWHVRVRLRRARVILLLRARALRVGATVKCSIAPDVCFGRRVSIRVDPRTANEFTVGSGCNVDDDVRIELGGGSLVLGDATTVRHGCVLFVRGRLTIQGPNLVQHGATFHCDEQITIEPRAVLSEYTTLVDSSHFHDSRGGWFLDELKTAPVVIEEDVWVCAKATVTRGVRIGKRAVVGANSLVVKYVPEEHLASGVPAKSVRRTKGASRCEDPSPCGEPYAELRSLSLELDECGHSADPT